jgi:hypothetical protein
MAWLWLIPYLIVGVVFARWMTLRYPTISRLDAGAMVLVWPVFAAFLLFRGAFWVAGGAVGKDS